MKNFLCKLFSSKWNPWKISKQKRKNELVTNDTRSTTVGKVFPLDRSVVDIIQYASREEKVHYQLNDYPNQQQLSSFIREKNPYIILDNVQASEKLEQLGKTSNAIDDDQSSGSTSVQSSTSESTSSTSTQEELHLLPFNTEPNTKELYNEMNVRELVNTVRSEIGELIDNGQGNPTHIDGQNANSSASEKKKSKKKSPSKSNENQMNESEQSTDEVPISEQCNNCCCNFIHYSLRQIMRDSEQMKQFALNTSMIGLDPSKLRDPTNTLCSAICLPMYNCEYLGDQRFPMGPTFTTISKNELHQADSHSTENRTNSMVIQSINTHRGPIQIRLDSQSFGLAPFFSDQYESFIKGPPNSIFFSSYMNIYQK